MLRLVPAVAALCAAGFLLAPAPAAAASKTAPKFETIGQVLEAPPALSPPLTAPLPAFAAPASPSTIIVQATKLPEASVAVPIGEWARAARDTLIAFATLLLGFALRRAPLVVVLAVKAYGEDRVVQQAVDLAINAIPGAVRGGVLDINVGSQVLAHAVQWIVDTAPRMIVKAMGGEVGIRAKIFARLNLEADASAAALGVATLR